MSEAEAYRRYHGRGAPRPWVEPDDDLLDWLGEDLNVDPLCPYVRQGAREEMGGSGLSDNPYYWVAMTPTDRERYTPLAKRWIEGWKVSAHYFGRLDRDKYEAHHTAFRIWSEQDFPWQPNPAPMPRFPSEAMKGPWPGPGRR